MLRAHPGLVIWPISDCRTGASAPSSLLVSLKARVTHEPIVNSNSQRQTNQNPSFMYASIAAPDAMILGKLNIGESARAWEVTGAAFKMDGQLSRCFESAYQTRCSDSVFPLCSIRTHYMLWLECVELNAMPRPSSSCYAGVGCVQMIFLPIFETIAPMGVTSLISTLAATMFFSL